MPKYVTGPPADTLDTLTQATAVFEQAQLAYWCAIDEAVAAGHSRRAVSVLAGLSHTGVSKIIERLYRQGRSFSIERNEQNKWIYSTVQASKDLPPY